MLLKIGDNTMKIVIGCDPNAQEAKEKIIKYIEKNGYGEVTDFGSEDPIYANVAIKVAEAVAAKEIAMVPTGLSMPFDARYPAHTRISILAR